MSKGYLILAQNNTDTDYLRLAYVNALSIKITQKDINSVCLLTDDILSIPSRYKTVFDHIIAIPGDDSAIDSSWKIENRTKIYQSTPFDETVMLDSDMLFVSDVSQWWKSFEKKDICIANNVRTYRNDPIINDRYYRRTFIENNLPNVYSAYTYFKKSDRATLFWKLVDHISKNWKEYYYEMLPNFKPSFLSMDVVFALSLRLLDMESEGISKLSYPNFVHLKGHNQGLKTSAEPWTNIVSPYFNKKTGLKIGNYQQHGIVHYTEKNIITDEIVKLYEDLYEESQNG